MEDVSFLIVTTYRPYKMTLMRQDRHIKIRVSSELFDLASLKSGNFSRYVRELIRNDLEESSKKTNVKLEELPPEIRVQTPYTFYAWLEHVVDGDTIRIIADLGFYIKADVKVRFSKVNAPAVSTKEGKKAKAFVEKELSGCRLVVETRKRDKYDRYVAFVYYHPTHKRFVDIVRHGKIINEEIVKAGLAKQIRR